MRPAWVLAVLASLLLGGHSTAQETVVREARCWLGSSTFSAGATMNAGDGVAVCDATTGWQATSPDSSAAGCMLEGDLSSVGAVVGVRNNDTVLLRCESSGSWVTIDAEE